MIALGMLPLGSLTDCLWVEVLPPSNDWVTTFRFMSFLNNQVYLFPDPLTEQMSMNDVNAQVCRLSFVTVAAT